MKPMKTLGAKLQGVTRAISRYPLTAAFLVAAAFANALAINTDNDYSKYLLTFALGAVLGAAAQSAYERYFVKSAHRAALMAGCVLLAAGYYLLIRSAPLPALEIYIRTAVSLFALLIAFLWVPVIRSKVTFNESFLAAFKAFFNSLLFSGVIFGGISIIIAAINQLLFAVDSRAYAHTANIVFLLFAPIYFLSLIPVYPGRSDAEKDAEMLKLRDERVDQAAHCPRFLEILISYIVIPLTSVFTVILVLYIVTNIRGDFWKDNLLEPMLVSYAIAVILVTILASRLENRFAVLFRRIFPKLLVPIVLFQIVSSVLKSGDIGITHSRYYVILFGIFAACAGVLLSRIPVWKNGIIAALLIAFCAVSVIPPVDAFTVSRKSQISALHSVLVENGMLENNVITPNPSISADDKQKIGYAVEYLSQMQYTGKIEWMPRDFNPYEDFYQTFGFYEYDQPDTVNQMIYFNIDERAPIDITGYDTLVRTFLSIPGGKGETTIYTTVRSDRTITLSQHTTGDGCYFILSGDKEQTLLTFDAAELLEQYRTINAFKGFISAEEATFTKENELAKLTFVVQSGSLDKSRSPLRMEADLFILVRLK